MPVRSPNKLTISSDDVAQSAPRSGSERSAREQPRIVIRDITPTSKSSRWPRWVIIFLPVGCLMLLYFSAWTRPPQSNWTEQIAATSDRSIVQIQTENGLGTGFVIASRGVRQLILTNRHVVASPVAGEAGIDPVANRCLVVLRNGQSIMGRLVGLPRDPNLDLALLEISVPGLRPLGEIAPFSDVRVGQHVVAVGHPHGLDFTVTDGIVSAKREGLLIQTSAAINPGNSGGPLIDEHLRVIGVNTLALRPDVAHGLGFAIRADIATDRTAWETSGDVADLLPSAGH